MFLSPSRARFVSSVQKCRRINKEDVIQKVPRIAVAARAASLARSVLSCVVVAANVALKTGYLSGEISYGTKPVIPDYK